MDQVSDEANETISNNLRQRSSFTETRITLRLVTQERTRTVCVPESSTLEDLKRFVNISLGNLVVKICIV